MEGMRGVLSDAELNGPAQKGQQAAGTSISATDH